MDPLSLSLPLIAKVILLIPHVNLTLQILSTTLMKKALFNFQMVQDIKDLSN